jgi:hypothetical protein
MAMCMEDGTLHRFRAHNTVLATGGEPPPSCYPPVPCKLRSRISAAAGPIGSVLAAARAYILAMVNPLCMAAARTPPARAGATL